MRVKYILGYKKRRKNDRRLPARLPASFRPYPNDVREREGGGIVHQRAILGKEMPPQRRQLPFGPSFMTRVGEWTGGWEGRAGRWVGMEGGDWCT